MWTHRRRVAAKYPSPIRIENAAGSNNLKNVIKNFGIYINQFTELEIQEYWSGEYDREGVYMCFYDFETEEQALKRAETEYKEHREKDIREYERLKEKFEGKI